jgi:hypothetical protein
MFYKLLVISLFVYSLTDFKNPGGHNVIPPCVFSNPDTSLCGIKLRDDNSTRSILGIKTKLEGDSTHYFYSKNKDQVLGLTIHPGDGTNVVSIFEIKYPGKQRPPHKEISVNSFITEKGICLGITRQILVKLLGQCYTLRTRKGVTTLSYRLDNGKDSRTKLLERQDMPVYYATYDFQSDKLIRFEFGFEYP